MEYVIEGEEKEKNYLFLVISPPILFMNYYPHCWNVSGMLQDYSHPAW